MNFEEDITIIVGENDSGKTSIIDAIKIIFGKRDFFEDDFSYGETESTIDVRINSRSFIKKAILVEDDIEITNFIRLDPNKVDEITREIESSGFESLNEEDKRNKLFDFFRTLGISPGNKRKIETLIQTIIERISELDNNDYLVPANHIPDDYNIFFLDGKEFKKIDEHVNDLYFGQIKRDIWDKEFHGETIKETIDNHLHTYSRDLETKMKDQGSISKLKEYLPGLTDIKIVTDPNPRLNVDVKIQLLEGTNIIPVENKGDGTKRRITMALLEIKKELDDEQSDSYIFDEPDTHLHVKAELDLLDILRGFVKNNKQVIITTHSPFILNSVKPDKVRLLSLIDNNTEIDSFRTEELNSTLVSLGINNTNLFFSKKIFIVEGHTEEIFFPMIFEKIHGINLENILVKIINGKGIEKAAMAARVFSDFGFADKKDIFILIDNDGSPKLKRFVDNLDIPAVNKREIGYKEFEDTFDPFIIYDAWKNHVFESSEDSPENYQIFEENWHYESIKCLRDVCIKNDLKFSQKLANFSRDICFFPMDKTELGFVLANHVKESDLDPKIRYIFEKLKE